jgi:hypothetical protein
MDRIESCSGHVGIFLLFCLSCVLIAIGCSGSNKIQALKLLWYTLWQDSEDYSYSDSLAGDYEGRRLKYEEFQLRRERQDRKLLN